MNDDRAMLFGAALALLSAIHNDKHVKRKRGVRLVRNEDYHGCEDCAFLVAPVPVLLTEVMSAKSS